MVDVEKSLSKIEDFLKTHPNCKFVKTASQYIYCSTLPKHWRSNKSLPNQFIVLILYPVEDGTKVTITAGNEENCVADIKNNVGEVHQQIAKFNDLRFVGKSGRGKHFNLTITIHRKDIKEVTVASSVIKVTVDGPRDSRNANKLHNPYNHLMNKRPINTPMIYPLLMNPTSSTSIQSYDIPLKRQKLDENNSTVKQQLIFNQLQNEMLRNFQYSRFNPLLLSAMQQPTPYPQIPNITDQQKLFQLLLLQQFMNNSKNNVNIQEKVEHVENSNNEPKKGLWRPFQ